MHPIYLGALTVDKVLFVDAVHTCKLYWKTDVFPCKINVSNETYIGQSPSFLVILHFTLVDTFNITKQTKYSIFYD